MVSEAISRRAGIIGGLGPEISSRFCLNVNEKFKDIANMQPDLVMENIPVSPDVEKELIEGGNPKKILDLLRNAVIRLNKSEVDFIVIPCNTVHFFLDDLRKISKKPILSIIEECVNECKEKKFRKIGLIATSKTIQEKLFENGLSGTGIDLLLPTKTDQVIINKVILNILNKNKNPGDKKIVMEIVKKLKNRGSEAVILGCTDISLLISSENCKIPVLETVTILENSLVKNLIYNR